MAAPTRLLRRIKPLMALFGHVTMCDLSPQSDPKRTLLDRKRMPLLLFIHFIFAELAIHVWYIYAASVFPC
jgi:hypothetical protein